VCTHTYAAKVTKEKPERALPRALSGKPDRSRALSGKPEIFSLPIYLELLQGSLKDRYLKEL
jgi:hypothetical protein